MKIYHMVPYGEVPQHTFTSTCACNPVLEEKSEDFWQGIFLGQEVYQHNYLIHAKAAQIEAEKSDKAFENQVDYDGDFNGLKKVWDAAVKFASSPPPLAPTANDCAALADADWD